MENLSLFDFLVGHFVSEEQDPVNIDSSYFDRMDKDKKLRQSIVENLKLILQSRQGSVLHLPDFGIPDFMKTYRDAAQDIKPFCQKIVDTILKYEPRIAKASLSDPNFDEKNMRLNLKIVATIKDLANREVLLTEFSTTGWSKVVFEKDVQPHKKRRFVGTYAPHSERRHRSNNISRGRASC